MDQILNNERLADKHFAVIFDEAHNSQTGATASKLQTTLSLSGKGQKIGATVEDVLLAMQESKKRPPNVPYYGFTATPKHSTLMIFGRTDVKPGAGGCVESAEDGEPLPRSFDVYPMRQAIEEGFILDVLQGYAAYKRACQLACEQEESARAGRHAAGRALAQWKALHPTNVTQKTDFIISHFLKNVAPLLNGQAKAMIVTSSRAAVVHCKAAFDRCLSEHPELKGRAFLKLGIPIAAFSGDVPGTDCIHEADKPGDALAEIDPKALYDAGV